MRFHLKTFVCSASETDGVKVSGRGRRVSDVATFSQRNGRRHLPRLLGVSRSKYVLDFREDSGYSLFTLKGRPAHRRDLNTSSGIVTAPTGASLGMPFSRANFSPFYKATATKGDARDRRTRSRGCR